VETESLQLSRQLLWSSASMRIAAR